VINIAVVGSGSVFSPELIIGFAQNADKIGPITLRFIDTDKPRQKVVSGFCRRLLKDGEWPLRVHKRIGSYDKPDSLNAFMDAPGPLPKNQPNHVEIIDCDDLGDCLNGVDFVLLQIRHGGLLARIEDERLGKKYKLPFTETISVCGFSTFLRTYYEYEKLGAAIKKYAPDAWVLNFTNPSAQLSETLSMMGIKKVVGICNGFMGTKDTIQELLGIEDGTYFMNWRGLNHLTVVDGIYHEGRNRMTELLEKLPEDYYSEFDKKMLVCLGSLLNGYFQYYFNREKVINKLQSQPRLRSETVKEIDALLLKEYKTAKTIPDSLAKRGGYGYATAVVNIVRAMCMNEGSIHYAIVPNGVCLPSLPQDAFVEVPVYVSKNGVLPIATTDLPDYAKGLAISLKSYERILMKAAKERDKRGMLEAMMTHPLLNCFTIAEPLLEDCLDINRSYLPDNLHTG